MTTMTYTTGRRQVLERALCVVLTPAQFTMVSELVQAERPHDGPPEAEDLFYWIRLNMPQAAARVDRLLHPAE